MMQTTTTDATPEPQVLDLGPCCLEVARKHFANACGIARLGRKVIHLSKNTPYPAELAIREACNAAADALIRQARTNDFWGRHFGGQTEN